AGVHLARRTRIRVVVRVHVPAVGRDLADGVHAVAQETPVGLRLAGSPGEAAADPDDRDGLRPRSLDGVELRLKALELEGRAPEERRLLAARGVAHCASSTSIRMYGGKPWIWEKSFSMSERSPFFSTSRKPANL